MEKRAKPWRGGERGEWVAGDGELRQKARRERETRAHRFEFVS